MQNIRLILRMFSLGLAAAIVLSPTCICQTNRPTPPPTPPRPQPPPCPDFGHWNTPEGHFHPEPGGSEMPWHAGPDPGEVTRRAQRELQENLDRARENQRQLQFLSSTLHFQHPNDPVFQKGQPPTNEASQALAAIERSLQETRRLLERQRRLSESQLRDLESRQAKMDTDLRQLMTLQVKIGNSQASCEATSGYPASAERYIPTIQPAVPVSQTAISPIANKILSFMMDKSRTGERTYAKDPLAAKDQETDVVIKIGSFPLRLDPNKTNCSTALLEAFQAATGGKIDGKEMNTGEWNDFYNTWQLANQVEVAKRGSVYRQGAVKAITDKNLGDLVPSLRDVKEGDIIQAFPEQTGTAGDLMMVLKVSDEGGGFVAINAGNDQGGNAYMMNGYSFSGFESRFKEYYIGRFKEK